MTSRSDGGNGLDAAPLYSVEAEQACLGGLLLDPDAWKRVAGAVRPEDFYRHEHQIIFDVIATLAGEGASCDVVTVANRLECKGHLQAVGGLAYLSSVARDTPTARNVRAYAESVVELAILRRVRQTIEDRLRGAELRERLELLVRRLGPPTNHEPLPADPASTWSGKPAPAPRDWVVEGLVPAGRVASLLADGGTGKTTLAVQIGVHVSLNRPLYGFEVHGGPVIGVFCEDEQDELRRRIGAACAAERIELEQLDQFIALSRDGQDNVLCTFERDRIVFTPYYWQLDATIAAVRPRLVILDTLADHFAGDYMSTPHARQFVRTGLGGLSVRHGCAVLVIAHPSMSGMNSGEGGGFSTAWNNAVRSRLYLRRPRTDDPEAAQDHRVLEVKKSNYAPSGVSVPLLWQAGAFVLDREPPEQTTGPATRRSSPRPNTRLALAVMEYLQKHATSGPVVTFRAIFDQLQKQGLIDREPYETVRKPLQRTLKQLADDGLLTASNVPRGYRLAPKAPHIDTESSE